MRSELPFPSSRKRGAKLLALALLVGAVVQIAVSSNFLVAVTASCDRLGTDVPEAVASLAASRADGGRNLVGGPGDGSASDEGAGAIDDVGGGAPLAIGSAVGSADAGPDVGGEGGRDGANLKPTGVGASTNNDGKHGIAHEGPIAIGSANASLVFEPTDGGASTNRDDKGEVANEKHGRIWIDVTTFAEGISGWRTSLAELLQLARAINGTIVEPCMTNGRLGSCFDHAIPASEIFDLANAMRRPSRDRPAPLASRGAYRDRRRRLRTVAGAKKVQYNLCMTILKKNRSGRCSAGSMYPDEIDGELFRETLNDPKNDLVVLQLDDYWKGHSSRRLATLFGADEAAGPLLDELDHLTFHPQHAKTVDAVLRQHNVSEDNFSAIHWRAEKKGMDYMRCAEAVLDAKRAMLGRPANATEGGVDRPFVLISSLHDDPNMMWIGSRKMVSRNGTKNAARRALDFLVGKHGFIKLGAKVDDPGILAVYDLILAQKARAFATCARDSGQGCDPVAEFLCDACNHVGKFGKLALSLRQDDSVVTHAGDSSWACWPRTEGQDMALVRDALARLVVKGEATGQAADV